MFGNYSTYDLPFCSVATQGTIHVVVEKNLVKNYKIATSSDGFDFITYQENSAERIFSGDLVWPTECINRGKRSTDALLLFET